MESKNLKKSPTGVWLYRRRVPKALSGLYEGNDICLSLETKSLTQARVKRDVINAEIDLKIQEVKSGKPTKQRFHELYNELKQDYREETQRARKFGDINDFEYVRPEDWGEKDQTYIDAYRAVLSDDIPDEYRLKISELAESWIEHNTDKKTKKYVSSVGTYSRALVEFLGIDELPENISPGMAQTFVDKLLDNGKTPATVTHYKSKLAEVWRWGLSRDKIKGYNPWKDVKVEATLEQKEQEHFREFSPEEAKVLLEQTTLEALTTDTYPVPFTTYAMVRLLPFLGCRRGELGLAKREQVTRRDGRYLFEVCKGKSKNAQRVIPVCPAAVPILEDTLERSKGSDRLFPEIKDENSLNTVSGRISKITKTFDKKPGYKISIHSLRVQHATALEEIDCPEELAVKVAGHKQLSLTYGLYSKYKGTDKLWPYINKLTKSLALSEWLHDLKNLP